MMRKGKSGIFCVTRIVISNGIILGKTKESDTKISEKISTIRRDRKIGIMVVIRTAVHKNSGVACRFVLLVGRIKASVICASSGKNAIS